jgi:hypothetical protein
MPVRILDGSIGFNHASFFLVPSSQKLQQTQDVLVGLEFDLLPGVMAGITEVRARGMSSFRFRRLPIAFNPYVS